jgi:hypothetical protein
MLLKEWTKATPAETKPESLLDAVNEVIAREKLDPKADYDRAIQLVMKEKPHLYNYGTDEQRGS